MLLKQSSPLIIELIYVIDGWLCRMKTKAGVKLYQFSYLLIVYVMVDSKPDHHSETG